MQTTETTGSVETTTSTNPAVLPSKIDKLIFLQRATITTLFSSLIVVAFYAHAAQNRAADWKMETLHLQSQLEQAQQNEAEQARKDAAAATNRLKRPDWKTVPPLHPGMTRADVERVLMPDGGLMAIGEERYVFPIMPATDPAVSQKAVKVTIHYIPANFGTTVDNAIHFMRDDDVITSISEPYLEERYMN